LAALVYQPLLPKQSADGEEEMMSRTLVTDLNVRLLDRSIWEDLPQSAWLRGLLVEGSERSQQTLETTYYDTPGRTLWKAGFVFCIRMEENEGTAMLARTGRGGEYHQRREWKTSERGAEVGLEVFDRMPSAEKIKKILQGDQPRLIPLFKMVFTRWSARVYSPADGWRLRLTLDKGHISAGEKVEDLFESEIGLEEGTPYDLLAFGAEFSLRFPVMPEAKSKYQRGLCLAELMPVRKGGGKNIWPSSADTFLAEAVGILFNALAAYYSTPDSPEKVHDLRIALRKLRSRLSFAAPLYSKTEGDNWKEVLRIWSRRMAGIRELDMLQAEWNAAAVYLGIESSQSLLWQYLQAQREKVSEPFYKDVGSGKMTTDLLAFWAWGIGKVTHFGMINTEWRDYSALRLGRWLKKFGKLASEVDISDATAMHALRIRGKKARYVLERQVQCGGFRKSAQLVGKMKQLQECLGEIQDTIQGSSIIPKMVKENQNTELTREIGALAGWQARRGYDARQRFEDEREGFRQALKQWRKAGGAKAD
jgi:inorganic triphosphatase YgiF